MVDFGHRGELWGREMPKAPDLEMAREFLVERILGVKVASASVIKPSVLRPLAGDL